MEAETFPAGEVLRWNGRTYWLVDRLPHYGKVPKDHDEQVAWRIKLRKKSHKHVPTQKALWKACEEDFLFWLNAFCWIVEPRLGEERTGLIPFNTWEHQDPIAAALDHYFGRRHIIGDKSRAQGASWLEIANCVHKFVFGSHVILGLGSKDAETADSVDNPDSLGWKFDFLLDHLPTWMKPPKIGVGQQNRKIADSTWKNVKNGSFCKAYSATAGIGRAGRFTSFFLDESAFFPPGKDTEAVSNLLKTTNGLVMISTPNGMNNEHYDRIHTKTPWLTIVLDWRDNPTQKKGKYTTKDGRLVFIDREYQHEDGYPFVLDGRIRSPWYDRKCQDDNNNMLLIGQELDREYSGSKGRPFAKKPLERAAQYCQSPIHTGMLFYENGETDCLEGMNWVEGEGYNFDLWLPVNKEGLLPRGDYTLGCDISAGVGGEMSSNSVVEIFNSVTREQVGELAINTIPPEEFAQLAVAICYWLGRGEGTPYLNWEKNGVGRGFTKEVIRLGYPNVYYQKSGDELRRYAKRTDRPGYHSSNTRYALQPMITALFLNNATFRSKPLLEECGQYVYNEQGKAEHPKARTSREGSARGESHGDRAIAASMALRAMDERPRNKKSQPNPKPQEVPNQSMAGREEHALRRRRDDPYTCCRW